MSEKCILHGTTPNGACPRCEYIHTRSQPVSESRKPREIFVNQYENGWSEAFDSMQKANEEKYPKFFIPTLKFVEVLPESSQSGVEGDGNYSEQDLPSSIQKIVLNSSVPHTSRTSPAWVYDLDVAAKVYARMCKENEALRSRCEKLEKALKDECWCPGEHEGVTVKCDPCELLEKKP